MQALTAWLAQEREGEEAHPVDAHHPGTVAAIPLLRANGAQMRCGGRVVEAPTQLAQHAGRAKSAVRAAGVG